MISDRGFPTAPVLIADDDEDDRMLVREAFEECHPGCPVRFVVDGQELLAYLRREGAYAEPARSPRPRLILLDLNMPRRGGFEALAEIRSDPWLREIPVVVLTTSSSAEDATRSQELGAAGYLTKPAHFDGLLELVRQLDRYAAQQRAEPPPEASPA